MEQWAFYKLFMTLRLGTMVDWSGYESEWERRCGFDTGEVSVITEENKNLGVFTWGGAGESKEPDHRLLMAIFKFKVWKILLIQWLFNFNYIAEIYKKLILHFFCYFWTLVCCVYVRCIIHVNQNLKLMRTSQKFNCCYHHKKYFAHTHTITIHLNKQQWAVF